MTNSSGASQSGLRPRRSCLYIPGSNARALEKGRVLAADVLILDLEDAVAPEEKGHARDRVAARLAAGSFGRRETVIRINDPGSEWGHDDLRMAIAARPDAILVPKINTTAEIMQVHNALTEAGDDETMQLWAMIETPQAILAINDIAAAAGLTALVMGTNDLATDMGITPGPDRLAFHHAFSATIMAARAHGAVVIDGVYNDIGNHDGFIRECEQAKQFGFDGKTLIHPSQIGACNRVFSPDKAAIAHARRVVAAFADPANTGKGVLTVDGKMVERLHLENARRLLAIARDLPD